MDLGGTDPAAPTEPAPERPDTKPGGWSAGRTAGVIAGTLVLLLGLGGAVGGGTLLWLDGKRDSDGYLTTPVERFSDDGYALRFDAGEVTPVDRDWPGVDDVLGDVRIRVSGVDSGPVFAGIARTSDVAGYLGGVPHGRYHGDGWDAVPMTRMRPPGMPMDEDLWVAQESGTGTLTLSWEPEPGEWSLVVMNATARPDVRADVAVAATAPALRPLAIGVLAGGVLVLAVGALVVALAARPRRTATRWPDPPTG